MIRHGISGTAAERRAEKTPIDFAGERSKVLYERLDAVLTTTANDEDLVEAVRTIARWRSTDELWKTLDRWLKTHDAH